MIGAPDSGLDAALGFSQASGIPYGIGLIKNKYIGRTFISPGQNQRMNQVRIKLSAVRASVEGKRVVLVDDSIVRGTTSGRIVNLLRCERSSHACGSSAVLKPLLLWYRH